MLRYWLRLNPTEHAVSEDDLSSIGYFEVPKRPEPYSDIYTWDIDNWEWVLDKELAIAEVSRVRFQHENGGIVVNGNEFKTDDRSKLMLLMAISNTADDKVYHWKLSDGHYVELSVEGLKEVYAALTSHMQHCFERERELSIAVEDGTFKPEEIEQGWTVQDN